MGPAVVSGHRANQPPGPRRFCMLSMIFSPNVVMLILGRSVETLEWPKEVCRRSYQQIIAGEESLELARENRGMAFMSYLTVT